MVGLTLSLTFIALPITVLLAQWGLFGMGGVAIFEDAQPRWLFESGIAIPLLAPLGALLLTSLLHLARGVGRLHAKFAKSLLVARVGPSTTPAAQSAAPLTA